MRKEDWPEILAKAVAAANDVPFAWGSQDCCLFAANVVLAITDEDYAAEFRGHYSTATGATKALQRYGMGSIRKTIDAKFGSSLPPLMARRGDLLLAMTSRGESLGVSMGATSAFKSPSGVAMLRLDACLCCWRVD